MQISWKLQYSYETYTKIKAGLYMKEESTREEEEFVGRRKREGMRYDGEDLCDAAADSVIRLL